MKGNPQIIQALNENLANELTAINQYMVHSEMCSNWKYSVLDEYIQKRAIEEMKHAEKLINKILFLEGTPIVSSLNQINIAIDVPKMMDNDHAAEIIAIEGYNAAIKLCHDLGDQDTKRFLEDILKDEIEHIDWIEAQQAELGQIGAQNYLAQQIYGDD